MLLRWTESASADLEQISDYLFVHTPLHATRLTQTIYHAPEILLRLPLIGRLGRMHGTRDLPMTPLPWVLVSVVGDDSIDVIRVLHGAQRWP
ncbi:MAG: type II toxin-antitoxin system RelE/ParE family toxin [Acidobacteriaceae bacterium]